MARASTVRAALCVLVLTAGVAGLAMPSPGGGPPITLVIHGGAGALSQGALSPEREEACRETLRVALHTGYARLARGGPALDAVVAAIRVLEDSPLFNAGRGAVFTHEGVNEMDAAIMEGASRRAGAVAGVHRIRNPILAARAVMERSPHVLLVGDGAERLAAESGLELVDPAYFFEAYRWGQLLKARERESLELDHAEGPRAARSGRASAIGTVGAVALDRAGNLAAGTSTGGMTNKRWGRVGDVPLIGAGTYASNASCAVSATGHGEIFIRAAVAHDIAALIEYRGLSVEEAARVVVMEKVEAMGGEGGGVIALDRQGRFAMPFNTAGMFRGWVRERHGPADTGVAIYRDE